MELHWLPAEDVCRQTLRLQDEYRYPIALIWRASAFRESADLPMTIRRARALNAVLQQCELPIQPGELLLGSGVGRFCTDAAQCQEIDDAQNYLTAIGNRSFITNSDHMAPKYATLVQKGIGGLLAETQTAIRRYQHDKERRIFLESVAEALQGVAQHCLRWAEAAKQQAEHSPRWQSLLLSQADMLSRLARQPAQTFWEALQLVYLTHCIFQLDDRGAMAFGRLDQFLYPFYTADIEAGRLQPAFAQELLNHFIAEVAHRSDIQNICIGGVDEEGNDATNELSYMLLEAVKRIGQPGGNLTARIHRGVSDSFVRKCVEVIRTGIGFPAVFNDDEEIPALVAQGYPLEEARNYCFVGCIEVFIPGRMAPWSDSRFNLLRCVNLVLWDGFDPVSGCQVGPHTGQPESWDAFYAAFVRQMSEGITEHAHAINATKQHADDRADDLTSPLLSALCDDCIERGMDICAGGAYYPANHGIGGMGIGSTADSLMAIKRFVFDQHQFSLDDMRRMLLANFDGFTEERQQLLHQAPKYGNDEEEVDEIAVDAARAFAQACLRHQTPRGGHFWGLMAANIQNISAGQEVGATPDGRLAFQPLSDAASPTFGRDHHGPTAVVKSVAKLDYRMHPGGNVINMKFHPTALAGEEGLVGLAALIRTCFALGGIQLQFNTTDRRVLLAAIENPEEYSNLVVRVSGFSAYFTGLDRAVQHDILARTDNMMAW
ncbi:MAG TPA: pyruvate formate lyase family protein [Armatimonadota bacterium]|nr:pyruvate formate lyase family protein [Armatimonadota bacterium]